jgi:hypothetical protein
MWRTMFVVGAVLGVLLSLAVGSAGAALEGTSADGLVLLDGVVPTGVEVAIDIRPGSECNPVNPRSNGVLPVGILSSETFDATEADPATVFLEGAPIASRSQHDKFLASEEDVNGDGWVDLVVKFETELLELVTPTGSAVLVGLTFDEEPFWGQDTFRLVPPDVLNDSWALGPIAACMAHGVVSGYPDGLYHPSLEVARDQMAAFITRAAAGGDSAVPKDTKGATFDDVAHGNWAYDYVEYASGAGIVQGYPDGSYHPDWVVTREQMAAFIARAIASPHGEEGLAGYQAPTTPTFPDVPGDSWCYRYVEYLAHRGVVSGYEDGSYGPANGVSREEMAVYVARGFQLPM